MRDEEHKNYFLLLCNLLSNKCKKLSPIYCSFQARQMDNVQSAWCVHIYISRVLFYKKTFSKIKIKNTYSAGFRLKQ